MDDIIFWVVPMFDDSRVGGIQDSRWAAGGWGPPSSRGALGRESQSEQVWSKDSASWVNPINRLSLSLSPFQAPSCNFPCYEMALNLTKSVTKSQIHSLWKCPHCASPSRECTFSSKPDVIPFSAPAFLPSFGLLVRFFLPTASWH